MRKQATTNLQAAVALYRDIRGLQTAGNRAIALLNLGISLCFEGRYAEAYAILQEAVDLFVKVGSDYPSFASDGFAKGLDMLGIAVAVAIQQGSGAGGSQGWPVNSWVRTLRVSSPHLVAVLR